MDIQFTDKDAMDCEFFYCDCGNAVYVKSWSLHKGNLVLEGECLKCQDEAYFFFTPDDLKNSPSAVAAEKNKSEQTDGVVTSLEEFRARKS